MNKNNQSADEKAAIKNVTEKKHRFRLKGITRTLGFKLRVVPLICLWIAMNISTEAAELIAERQHIKMIDKGAVTVQAQSNQEENGDSTKAVSNEGNEFKRNITGTVIFLQIGVFIIAFLIMNWIASSIIKPLEKLSEVAEDVSKGDLTKAVKVKTYSGDVIGKLSNSLINMKESLKTSISTI